MSERKGHFKVAEIRGTSVWVHWSLPVGGGAVALLGHVDPREWLFYCLAFTALIAVHEAGHVIAALAQGLRVFEVEISGLGGRCRFEHPHRIGQSFLVYAGGLLAQLALLLPTLAYVVSRNGFPPDSLGRAFSITFTFVNVVVLILNLIPMQVDRTGLDTDGSKLWRLFLHVFKGHPHPDPLVQFTPPEQAPVFPPEASLLEMPDFRQPGFVHGIEVFNDKTTPMEFVVDVFQRHLGLTLDQAVHVMLDIHNKGGALIPLSTQQEAARVAEAMSVDARAAGHAFRCRYVDSLPSA